MLRRLCWAVALSFLFLPLASAQSKPQGTTKQPSAAARTAQAPSEDRRREAERDEVRERERWFYQQRAFPFKRIPPGARARALQRVVEMRRAERQRGFVQAPGTAEAISANTMTWTPIGPQPSNSGSIPGFGSIFGLTSGRVSALAVNPANPDDVYAGGAQGGVWRSTDGGANWVPLTDDQPSLAIGSIALDSTTCSSAGCQTIYVGTGEQAFSGDSYYGAGILKSTDGGATWTQLGQAVFGGPVHPNVGGAHIGSLVVNRGDPQVLLAGVQILVNVDTGTSSGIYRSTDGGQNWTKVLSGAVGTEVFFDPANPDLAWAALGSPGGDSENGIYRSANRGATWTRNTGTNLPTTGLGRIEIAVSPSSPSSIYASIADATTGSSDLLGFFRTIDGGANWTRLTSTPDFCTPQCMYDHVIRVHPNNAGVVYAGGSAAVNASFTAFVFLIRSTDGGNSWTSIAPGTSLPIPHVDQHAFAFGFSGTTATRLYIGNDGGVWRTDVTSPTGGITWTNLNGSTNPGMALGLTQHYPGLAIHPSSENVALSGSQDNDTHRYDGSLLWQQIGNFCDGGWSVIDPFIPSTWYATCQFTFIVKSVQNGQANTFTQFADNGIDFSDSVEFIAPFVADPNTLDRLYFGTFRVWQTNNGGQSWQAVSPDVSGGSVLETIAVAPLDPNVVYVGSGAGTIQRTLNAGAGTSAVWTDVTGTGLPGRFITQIAVHPTLTDTLFAAFSGFGSCSGCDGMGHIFRSTTGGIAWIDISGNLPDTPVNDIVVDPNDLTGNTLYIGTDVGVFFTTDGGVSWSTLMTGLPNVAVFSLKLHPTSRILRAATHGRSVWDLQLPGLPPYHLRSVDPVSFNASDGFTRNMAVRGAGFTASSVVEWNGQPLVTTPDSTEPATKLNATVPNTLIGSAQVGIARVRVNDPAQGITNELAVTVVGAVPVVNSIDPTLTAPGSTDLQITVNGTNFSAESVVRFNGQDLATTFFGSPSRLFATIPASLMSTSGIFPVTVFSGPPGGGESQPAFFTVTGPPPPNDNFANAIVISGTSFSNSQNTVGATTEAGDPSPGSFATCSGAGRNFSIWYRYTPTSNVTVTIDTGASQYDTVLSVWSGTALGSLTAVACNDDAFIPGGPSQLTVALTAGTTYNFMITGFGPQDAGDTNFNFSVAVAPPNDNFASATAVDSAPFFDNVNSALATTASTDPTPGCASGAASNGRAKSIWYRFTPGSNTTVDAGTFLSGYDTILSAWTGTAGNLTSVACNDDTGGGLQSAVSFSATANTTYYFMVTAFSNDGGPTVFSLFSTVGPASDFSMSPSPGTVTVARGQSGTSTITVSAIAGFSGSVTLSCSGLPSRSTCALNPTSVTPGANPATSTLTITTTAGAGLFPPPPGRVVPVPVAAWWIAALLAVLALAVWRRKSPSWRWVGVSMLLLVMALALLQMACGGGGDGGSPPPPPPTGTPPGTYTVTVSGTSGTLTRTTTVTLTVN